MTANPPFLWGVATSSHQVEGNNFFNDWWDWEKQGKTAFPSGTACDHFRRFRDDLDLFKNLGHTAHRFSLEWSRFEPEENVWSEEAFLHYEQFFKELHGRGIEPVVTLHHFTNPLWFARQGGWKAGKAAFLFDRYVKKVVQAYRPYVRFWITINEPLVYIFHSYYTGLWPPGYKSFRDCKTVYAEMLKAHVRAYATIHQLYNEIQKNVWVSVAHHMTLLAPCRKSSLKDRTAVFLRNWFSNFLLLDAAVSGFLFFPGLFCELLEGRQSLDFIGVNYYSRDFVHFAGLSQPQSLGEPCREAHHASEIREKNSLGWEVYPEGLYHLLKRLRRFHLPVMITENGICTEDDAQRVRFIRDHLSMTARAMEEGVDVCGYFYWSGLDNFEWHHGFGPRFGIIDVNYENQQRKVRDSAQVLTECCRKLIPRGD